MVKLAHGVVGWYQPRARFQVNAALAAFVLAKATEGHLASDGGVSFVDRENRFKQPAKGYGERVRSRLSTS
ncbi:MAG: hypothetical protein HOI95_23275 [Chromatiales bacterium]|nr:hypothetical protein [Chromatiales bacterium]